MKFGILEMTVQTRLGPMAVPETDFGVARLAGADSFWVPDHLNNLLPRSVVTPKYTGAARLVPDVDALLEPWTVLGNLAGRHRFSRMRLGTAVTDTARRNPAVTAQAAATLHLMTRGRAILGIGSGIREGNEPYGVDWSKPVGRFVEGLATIRALWNSNGQLVNRDSEWFPLRNAMFALPPYRGKWPEIWVASHGPRMLRATGRYADGWLPTGIWSPGRYADGWLPTGIWSPEQYADDLEKLRTAADDANRDPQAITAGNTFFVVTGRTAGEVEGALDSVPTRAFALNLPAWAWAEHGARHPLGDDFTGFQDILPQTYDEQSVVEHAAAVPLSLLKQSLMTGTPDEILDRLASWRDHGLRYPVMANMSVLQTKLTRGLKTVFPFAKVMRGIGRL